MISAVSIYYRQHQQRGEGQPVIVPIKKQKKIWFPEILHISWLTQVTPTLNQVFFLRRHLQNPKIQGTWIAGIDGSNPVALPKKFERQALFGSNLFGIKDKEPYDNLIRLTIPLFFCRKAYH
jgi:hypothetical protein